MNPCPHKIPPGLLVPRQESVEGLYAIGSVPAAAEFDGPGDRGALESFSRRPFGRVAKQL